MSLTSICTVWMNQFKMNLLSPSSRRGCQQRQLQCRWLHSHQTCQRWRSRRAAWSWRHSSLLWPSGPWRCRPLPRRTGRYQSDRERGKGQINTKQLATSLCVWYIKKYSRCELWVKWKLSPIFFHIEQVMRTLESWLLNETFWCSDQRFERLFNFDVFKFTNHDAMTDGLITIYFWFFMDYVCVRFLTDLWILLKV